MKLKKNKFLQLWLIIGITTGFAAVVFFTITYLNNSILCSLDCRQRNEVQLILIMLSLFGMFIGSLTYYFISERYEKKLGRIHKDIKVTLRFLNKDQKEIIKVLLENKGQLSQAKLARKSGLSRVKTSRILKSLEDKGIITRTKSGMTYQVMLTKDLKELFF